MLLPRFLALSLWATSYARPSAMSRETPQHLVVLAGKNTISCVTIRFCSNLDRSVRKGSSSSFPPSFRWLSASSRQPFHRLLHRDGRRVSFENPRVSHNFYDEFSCEKSARIERSFSSAFSCFFRNAAADTAGRKMGESGAESEICGKSSPHRSRHNILRPRERVHTQCGTWNNFPLGRASSRRWRRRRRMSLRRSPVAYRVERRSAAART